MDAPPSDAVLVRYLLGTASRDDEERFDALSITDPAFAERLRAIEHDLADQYVRNELSPSDRDRWEIRYLASRHGLDDLALADALAAREQREKGKLRQSWMIWGLAAAAVLFVAAMTGYLRSHQPAPAASQTVVRQPTAPPSPPESHESRPVTPRVVALVLMPSVRSISAMPTLEIPPGTTEVKLTLHLEPDGHDHYVVQLRDLASNSVVWRADRATATGAGADRAIVVSIPASTFRQQRYLINVNAATAGTPETVATYAFAVVLQ